MGRLFERHADAVDQYVRFTLGSAPDAEDVVREAFLEALGAAWPRFEGRSAERTWLWVIARHGMLDRMRRRRRQRTEPLTERYERPEPAASDSALRVDLERSPRRLPLAQRQAFVPRIVLDRSTAASAELLSWSEVPVRVIPHRAPRALGRYLEGTGPAGKGEGAAHEGHGVGCEG